MSEFKMAITQIFVKWENVSNIIIINTNMFLLMVLPFDGCQTVSSFNGDPIGARIFDADAFVEVSEVVRRPEQ